MKKTIIMFSLLLAAGPVLALGPLNFNGADGADAEQYLPPDNDEPGFDWSHMPDTKSAGLGDFLQVGGEGAFLKAWPDNGADLANGTGKCALGADTRYRLVSKPGFEGVHMVAELAETLPGCEFRRGYVSIGAVAASSAGGLCELPRAVRAFMETIAYAEGTKDRYDYIYTFQIFKSYADHPRRRVCSGGLCSTAAGRFQFLTKTWDPLASALGLRDFTPPNQDKAGLELVRRAGAYNLALKSDNYENFAAALRKVNRIWASLPGSPYGQHTRSTGELWKFYRSALAKY